MLISSILVSLILYTWKNRTVVGARYFLYTLLLVEVWILGQAFELAALDLPTKIIWANIEYIPITLTSVTYYFLVLEYTRRETWLKSRWVAFILLIVPIVINILVWTNDMHGLIRQNIYLDVSGSFPTVGKTYGPAFWAFAVYNYTIALLAMVVLINAYREKISLYRKQIMFVFISLLLPVIANLIQVTGLNPFHIDITPPILGISALVISWGIFRYRLFDVVPIAHSIIIREMRTGMIVLDNEGRFLDLNPAARKMLDLTSKNLIGCSIETVLSDLPELIRIYREGKDAICEIAFRDNHALNYYEISFTQVRNREKEFIGWLLQIYDITERKIAGEIIKYAAFHDPLTGLPNRTYFQILFSRELAHTKMRADGLTVVFLDLDDFKSINDTWGHDIGDRVLCEAAVRLKGILRESDIISRIGGDEFAIVLPHVGSDETINKIGPKILETLTKSFKFQDGSVQIKASIGFSVFPRDGDTIEDLLKKADKAMYIVKDADKNSYSIYEE